MIGALAATGPHPHWAEKLNLFGQFVGEWAVSIVYYPAEGGERRMEGEWLFGWALEGRAIQDVWIAQHRSQRGTSAGSEPTEYGTTVRFYDPSIDAWRSTWIGPVRGVVMPFIGRPVGEEIVLEGTFAPGVSTRWIFSQITPQTFHWRAEESRDGWKTRWLQQEMRASRRSG
jgi:hypothetical protein